MSFVFRRANGRKCKNCIEKRAKEYSRVSSGTGNIVSLAFPESCNAPHTSRTPQLQDYVSLSFSLRVLSCSRALILPREGGFSLAINKEREERLRAEMYLVLLILGKFQWMHCGNPACAWRRKVLKDRKTVKWVLRRAEYEYSYVHLVSLVSLSSL